MQRLGIPNTPKKKIERHLSTYFLLKMIALKKYAFCLSSYKSPAFSIIHLMWHYEITL